MSRRWRQILTAVIIMLALIVPGAVTVCASDDNSLASLGIKTQGVSVSPEFKYDVWEYSVEVPAGTKELELEPHTTNPNAEVNSVTGTTLSEDGTGRVVITVTRSTLRKSQLPMRARLRRRLTRRSGRARWRLRIRGM